MHGHLEKKFHSLQVQFDVLRQINEKWDWEFSMLMSSKELQPLFSKCHLLFKEMLVFRDRQEAMLPVPDFINDVRKMIIYLQVLLSSMASDKSKSIDFLCQAMACLQHYRNKLAYENDETFYRLLYQIAVNIRGVEKKAEHVELLWEYFDKYEAVFDSAQWPLLSARFDGYHFLPYRSLERKIATGNCRDESQAGTSRKKPKMRAFDKKTL